MTRKELTALAETAEERTKGYLRAALKDPDIKAAMHSRYVPTVLDGEAATAVANDPSPQPTKGRRRA